MGEMRRKQTAVLQAKARAAGFSVPRAALQIRMGSSNFFTEPQAYIL